MSETSETSEVEHVAKEIRDTEDAVRAYLRLVMSPSEEEPRTQRDARDNEMMILGFNRAQEILRDVLAQVHGDTKKAERAHELAEVRQDGQLQPTMMGDQRVWMT